MSFFKKIKSRVDDKITISRLKVQLEEARSNISGLLDRNVIERGDQISDFQETLDKEKEKIKEEYGKKLENKQTQIDTLTIIVNKSDQRLKDGYELIGEQQLKISNLLLRMKTHVELLKNYKAEEINNSGAIIQEADKFLNSFGKFKKNMNLLIEE